MARRRTTWFFDDSMEVEEGYVGRNGAPGLPRLKKKKATPEQIRNQNRINKEKRIRRKIKANIRDGDYWVTLTYRKEERPPDIEEAGKHISNMFEKLRRRYKIRGEPMKWFLHTEIGSKGGVHHHLLIRRIPGLDLLLRKLWKYGGVHIDIASKEGFKQIASYLAKEPTGENKLKESKFRCSRNLVQPKVKKEKPDGKRWRKEPKPPKGFYLDKESYYEGTNPITGYPYRYYTFIKLERRQI